MNASDFEIWADTLAHALAMSRKLQARYAEGASLLHGIPKTTPAEQWRELIHRLNRIDPEGGWGRMKIGDVEFVAVKGTTEIPGSVWDSAL